MAAGRFDRLAVELSPSLIEGLDRKRDCMHHGAESTSLGKRRRS